VTSLQLRLRPHTCNSGKIAHPCNCIPHSHETGPANSTSPHMMLQTGHEPDPHPGKRLSTRDSPLPLTGIAYTDLAPAAPVDSLCDSPRASDIGATNQFKLPAYADNPFKNRSENACGIHAESPNRPCLRCYLASDATPPRWPRKPQGHRCFISFDFSVRCFRLFVL
jgi:hypothetical protein